MAAFNPTRAPITDAIRTAASAFLASGKLTTADDRRKLRAIADPASGRQFIDINWWRFIHGVTKRQAETAARTKHRALLEKLEHLADPERNPNEHERKVAAAKLAKLRAQSPEAAKPASAPGLEEFDRQQVPYEDYLRRWRSWFNNIPKDPVERAAYFEQRREEVRAENRAKRAAARARRAETHSDALSRKVADSTPPKAETHSDAEATEATQTHSDAEATKATQTRSDAKPPRWAARNAARAAERARARAGLVCQHCGKSLNAKRPFARFCSSACRVKAWRAR
jgi:hypothetical protein